MSDVTRILEQDHRKVEQLFEQIEKQQGSIRAKLEKMVSEENSAKPLTDQQIVHLFQEQGIQIARRTVAKYRDQLGILPARMRKRV